MLNDFNCQGCVFKPLEAVDGIQYGARITLADKIFKQKKI